MQELMGKEVEVNTAGVIYRGILVEISETEVQLQTSSGWITVHMDRVADIKAIN